MQVRVREKMSFDSESAIFTLFLSSLQAIIQFIADSYGSISFL